MPAKRFRLTIDLQYPLENLTEEKVKHDLRHYGDYKELVEDPLMWEAVERQQRLWDAIKNNPEIINQLLISHIISVYLSEENVDELYQRFNIEPNTDKILDPAIESLGLEDINYFRKEQAAGLLPESMEHIWLRLSEKQIEVGIDEVGPPSENSQTSKSTRYQRSIRERKQES